MQSSFTSVPVILVTEQHVLTGEVTVGPVRLLEVLNDKRTDYIKLADLRAYRTNCKNPVATMPRAIVRKSNVVVAMLIGDKHEAPQKRYDSFSPKQRYGTYLIAGTCEVRGEVALKATDDPVTALCHELDRFFPVPGGTVILGGFENEQHSCQVVIVNKDHVSLFQLNEPTAEMPPAAVRAETLQGAPG